jgi:Tfp pilus assembly protein PilF
MPSYQRLFFLLSLLLLLCYSNTFHCAWQFDDKPNILNNRPIQITSLSLDQIWKSMHARPGTGGLLRPVSYVTLALNWYIGKNDVFGYHIVNFLIHLGTAVCLFLTIQLLFQTPELRRRYTMERAFFIASVTSLFWAVNPIQTQAVTYIIQRMASLAALFSVLALMFYLKARIAKSGRSRSILFTIAVFFYITALFSKENSALLFLMVPVIEILFFKVRITNKYAFLKLSTGLFLSMGLCLLMIITVRPESLDFIFNYYSNRPFTMTERFFTEQRILLLYLSQLFFPFPSRLSIEHDITLSTSLFSPWTTTAAVAVNILIVSLAFKLYRRQPLFTLAVLFFYINHIIESTIVPLELVFEHRNYLPSIFLFLPVANGLSALSDHLKNNYKSLVVFHIILSMIIGIQGYFTYTRNLAWKTEQSLWIDAMVKAPNSARPMATLAIMLAWGDNPTQAKYRKALELTERTLDLRMSRRLLDVAQIANMASIYNKIGEYNKAVAYYEKALALSPKNANNRYNFAKALLMNGEFASARDEIEILLDQGYLHSDYFNSLGFVDLWMGNPLMALQSLQKALKLSPDRADVLLAVACAMSDLKYYKKATWFLNRAQEKGGKDIVVSLVRLHNALRQEDKAAANSIWKRMLARYPLPNILVKLRPTKKRYLSVPLDDKILKPYISEALGLLDLNFTP